MVFELDLQLAPPVEPGAYYGNAGRIDWSILSEEVIYNYGANTELLLSNIVLPNDALLCKDCNCTNDSHKVALMSAMVSGKEEYSPHICFVLMSTNLARC